MSRSRFGVTLLVLGCAVAMQARAEGGGQGGDETPPAWKFGVTVFPTAVRNGENYTSAIATADRDWLHLEARTNYESVGARSAFVGVNFAGGGDLAWELTPIVGGVWGTTRGFVPGIEASLAWRRFDLYVEAEYVNDPGQSGDSYFYAWSELGFRPVEWIRLGVAGQRTRAYGVSREIQRGPFAQATVGPLTIGAYWFNPGGDAQVVVGTIGIAF